MNRQTKSALAALLGAAVGLGTLAGVVLALRAENGADTAAPEPPATSVAETGTAGELPPGEESPAERTQTIRVGRFPTAVAVGEGAVWVMREGRRVVRIDPATGEVVARIRLDVPVGAQRPCGIDAGEGAVWVVSVEGEVVRIDPATDSVAGLIETPDPSCIAAGGGSVWVTSASRGMVTRIDPATNAIADEITIPSSPQGIAVGAGSVWVASSAPPNGVDGFVSRIDPETGDELARIPVADLPEYLAVGARSVWVTANNGTIRRLSARTNQLVGLPVRIAEGGRTMVAVGGGSIWATSIEESDVAGTVVQIDPVAAEIIGDPIPVGRSPLGMAFGAGSLWVANFGGNTVTWYAP